MLLCFTSLNFLDLCTLTSHHILLQPLFPLLFGERTTDALLLEPVKKHRRTDMHPHHPRGLDHPLDIVRDPIPGIQTPIRGRRIANPQQPHHLLLINPDTLCGQARQPRVRLIPALGDDAHVEVIGLTLEQRRGEIPEPRRRQLEHGQPRLVRQGRGRVPGLDVLAEDQAQFGRVSVRDEGRDGAVHGVEHLGGEGADVVEVCGESRGPPLWAGGSTPSTKSGNALLGHGNSSGR
jgi:hypothetical protein